MMVIVGTPTTGLFKCVVQESQMQLTSFLLTKETRLHGFLSQKLGRSASIVKEAPVWWWTVRDAAPPQYCCNILHMYLFGISYSGRRPEPRRDWPGSCCQLFGVHGFVVVFLSFIIIICLTIAQGVHRMPESSSFQGSSHLSWPIISFLRKSARCSPGYRQFLLFAPAIEYFIPIRSRRILMIQLHSCYKSLHVYTPHLTAHPSHLPLSGSSNRHRDNLLT